MDEHALVHAGDIYVSENIGTYVQPYWPSFELVQVPTPRSEEIACNLMLNQWFFIAAPAVQR